MSLLTRLNDYYPHLVDRGLAAPLGFSNEKISFVIVLKSDGTLAHIDDLRDLSKKKPVLRTMGVPQAIKRSSGVKANFLWDKSSYVLGLTKIDTEEGIIAGQGKRTAEEFQAFKELTLSLIGDNEDEGLTALRLFLENWNPEAPDLNKIKPDILDENLVFALENDYREHNQRRFLHQRPAALPLVQIFALGGEGEKGPKGMCLVTGEEGPIVKIHPSIKGVMGAQSSGASLVSFNASAFEFNGRSQGENAPISIAAANRCAATLNTLLRKDSGQSVRIGDTATIFWAENQNLPEKALQETESLLGSMLQADEEDKSDLAGERLQLREILQNLAAGKATEQADQKFHPDTQIYILGLAPNAARLSVRYWHFDRLAVFAQHFLQHQQDMEIAYVKDKQSEILDLPYPWQILSETALGGQSKNISPHLGGSFMRALLTGAAYPHTLLSGVIARIRADGKISIRRAAICKACVNRYHRVTFQKETLKVSLDENNISPAYRLGRLFSLMENAQQQAIGQHTNATIRDKYFGSASATPARVFPMLVRNAMNHLAKLRKDPSKKAIAFRIEKDVTEIFAKLEAQMPKTLTMLQQGEFVTGYFHQKNFRHDKHASETE